jgi:hypothetical protein
MQCLALELGPFGIRVNTIAPGLIMTDDTAPMPERFKQMMADATPLRRNGQPADVADAILMLVRDEAAFVTGTYINVDGGREAGQAGQDISAVNRTQLPSSGSSVGHRGGLTALASCDAMTREGPARARDGDTSGGGGDWEPQGAWRTRAQEGSGLANF